MIEFACRAYLHKTAHCIDCTRLILYSLVCPAVMSVLCSYTQGNRDNMSYNKTYDRMYDMHIHTTDKSIDYIHRRLMLVELRLVIQIQARLRGWLSNAVMLTSDDHRQ